MKARDLDLRIDSETERETPSISTLPLLSSPSPAVAASASASASTFLDTSALSLYPALSPFSQVEPPKHLYFIRHAQSKNNLIYSLTREKIHSEVQLVPFIERENEEWLQSIRPRVFSPEFLAKNSGIHLQFFLEEDKKRRRAELTSLLAREAKLLLSFKDAFKDPSLTLLGDIQAAELPRHRQLCRLSGKAIVFISPTYRTLATARHLVASLHQKLPGPDRVLALVIPSIAERGSCAPELPLDEKALPSVREKITKEEYGLPTAQLEAEFPLYNFSFLKSLEQANLAAAEASSKFRSDRHKQVAQASGWNWWPESASESRTSNPENERQMYDKRVLAVSLWLSSFISSPLCAYEHIFIVSHGDFLSDLIKQLLGGHHTAAINHKNAALTHLTARPLPSPSPSLAASLPPRSRYTKREESKLFFGPAMQEIATMSLDEIRKQWGPHARPQYVIQTMCASHDF